MISSFGLWSVWMELYAMYAFSHARNQEFDAARSVARYGVAAAMGTALRGRVTPFGPVEYGLYMASSQACAYSTCQEVHGRHDFWVTYPRLPYQRLRWWTQTAQTLRLLSLVGQYTEGEIAIFEEEMRIVDPVLMSYGGRRWSGHTDSVAAHFLPRLDSYFLGGYDTQSDEFQVSRAYFEGELYRTEEWFRRAMTPGGVARHGRKSGETDDRGDPEPQGPGGQVAGEWAVRKPASWENQGPDNGSGDLVDDGEGLSSGTIGPSDG